MVSDPLAEDLQPDRAGAMEARGAEDAKHGALFDTNAELFGDIGPRTARYPPRGAASITSRASSAWQGALECEAGLHYERGATPRRTGNHTRPDLVRV